MSVRWTSAAPHVDACTQGLAVFRVPDHAPGESHAHRFLEIVWIESGHATHRSLAGSQRLSPGDLLVLRPGVWHAYEATDGLTLINCLMTVPWLDRFESMLPPDGWADPRNPASARPLWCHPSDEAGRAIYDRLTTAIDELATRPKGWVSRLTACGLELLVLIARLDAWEASHAKADAHGGLRGSPPVMPTRGESAVAHAARHIRQHPAEPIDLTRLAKASHVSPAHLSRCFTRIMGLSLVNYQHQVRCELACERLRRESTSIAQIAEDLGYHDPSYFYRRFRQAMRCTPSSIRGTSG